MKATLQFIWLEVADLTRSREFYAHRLGWPVVEESEAYVSFDLHGPRLYLAVGQPRPAGMYLAVAVPDVDALYERLVAAGMEVAPPQDEGWARYIEITDPDGYPLLMLTPAE